MLHEIALSSSATEPMLLKTVKAVIFDEARRWTKLGGVCRTLAQAVESLCLGSVHLC